MSKQTPSPTLARALAPEEIRPGSYVAVLHYVCQWLPCASLEDPLQRRTEPFRIAFVPFKRPVPLKVIDVCVPFVLVKRPDRTERVIDVRRYRLAGLDTRFARRARKALRASEKPSKSREASA